MCDHRTRVVVVGAGPAGLACAACLARRQVAHVVLERADHVGEPWRRHYERLRLHTNKRLSRLPGLGFPRTVPRYPSRGQVVAYLEAYARHHGIRPRYGHDVTRVARENGRWCIAADAGSFEAAHVIIATGYNAEPVVPAWPGLRRFPGTVLHSAAYRNGRRFRDQAVLVVGLGNSGGEIAVDLAEHGARPTIAVRGPVNLIPRELFGIPILAVSIPLTMLPPAIADAVSAPLLRVAMGNRARLGLRVSRKGPFRQIAEDGRIPLIDVGTAARLRDGSIDVRPAIDRFEGREAVFTDGRRGVFAAIVLATGFRPTVRRLLPEADVVTDDAGVPRRSGRPTSLPGLWFCGFHISPTGMLREIGCEARRIARAIVRAA